MDNIIDFNKPKEPEAAPMFDYTFRRNIEGAEPVTVTGHFTFNPIFAGVVDDQDRLIYAVPMGQLADVYRNEPKGAAN